jgi:hypothetical protein
MPGYAAEKHDIEGSSSCGWRLILPSEFIVPARATGEQPSKVGRANLLASLLKFQESHCLTRAPELSETKSSERPAGVRGFDDDEPITLYWPDIDLVALKDQAGVI